MKAPLVRRRDVLRDPVPRRVPAQGRAATSKPTGHDRGLRTREAASARRREDHTAGLILAKLLAQLLDAVTKLDFDS